MRTIGSLQVGDSVYVHSYRGLGNGGDVLGLGKPKPFSVISNTQSRSLGRIVVQDKNGNFNASEYFTPNAECTLKLFSIMNNTIISPTQIESEIMLRAIRACEWNLIKRLWRKKHEKN